MKIFKDWIWQECCIVYLWIFSLLSLTGSVRVVDGFDFMRQLFLGSLIITVIRWFWIKWSNNG